MEFQMHSSPSCISFCFECVPLHLDLGLHEYEYPLGHQNLVPKCRCSFCEMVTQKKKKKRK